MYGRKHAHLAAACAAAVMLTGVVFPVQAADTAPLRVMCLGDSVTDGFWLPGGYRNTLCSLITENGLEQHFDFVGPNWGGSGYDPQHAGYSGYSIDNIAQEDSVSGQRTGLSSFAEQMMAQYPADLVFMQIGTNDILSLYDLEHFGERLEGLTEIVLRALPDQGALCLATLPVMDANDPLYISPAFFSPESMDAAVEDCNAQIRALAQKLTAEGKPVYLAEINHVLTKSDLYDGVHPNAEGYEKMGRFWYQKLLDYRAGTLKSDAESAALPMGDVNGDGSVSAEDCILLSEYLTGRNTLSSAQADRSDPDGSRRLNAADLTLLKRGILQKSSES